MTSASAGWGVHIQPQESGPADLWGPVIVNSQDSDWIGAFHPTNLTAEVSAFFTPFNELSPPRPTLPPGRTIISSLTAYTASALTRDADNSIKGCCNKALIAKVRRVLSQVKLRYNLSIGWTKAHTGFSRREPLGIRQRIV